MALLNRMKIYVPLLCVLATQSQLLLCQETAGSVLPVPVAIYPLNAKFSVKDGSCYGNEAGRQKGVNLAAGPYNQPETAFEFMGTRQSYIEIPASQQLDTRYSMTVLAWVYYNGPSSGPIFSYVEKQGLGVQLWVMRQGKLFARLMARDGRLSDIVTLENDDVNLTGNWHYVGVSFDHSSRRATLWIDGRSVQEKITLDKLELKTGGMMRLGSVSRKHTKHFKGKISCIQVYNKALSHSEVKAVKDRCLLDGEDPVNCRTVSFNGTCREHFTKKSGTFYSPGYPSGYPANIECVWTIHTKTNRPVKLKFKVFSLEDNPSKCSDYVEIKDGLGSWDIPLKKFCGGANVGEDWIESTSDSMRVKFVTNGFVGGLGFMAQYNSSDITEGNPDLNFHYTAIVIGVACAALFSVVTMLLVSRTRRLWYRHRRGSRDPDLSSESDRNSPDIVEQGAPPSYAAVMRSPQLYPPSPRVTPVHSTCGTPVLTPKFGPHSGTPVASRISLATTLSSVRHSQCAITDINFEDDEEPPPYPGIVVPPCSYSRQSSLPLTISPLLYNGIRRKSQGDLDRSLDRYSRNLGRPVSALGNTLGRPSSFSRRPSPLITSCHQHSNRSLPGCTAGSRQACSTWQRQRNQSSDRCFGHPCPNEQRRGDFDHNSDRERSFPTLTELNLQQNQHNNSEECQEQRECSRNSSCLNAYFDEEPPPYPETEAQPGSEAVRQGEFASSNNLNSVMTDNTLASGGQNGTNSPKEHHANHPETVNRKIPQIQHRTPLNHNNLESNNNLSSSRSEGTTEHEDSPPEDSHLATSLQQQQNDNICSSSKNVNKNLDVVDSSTQLNSENDSYDSPWQRRLSPARRRERALHRSRVAGERPDSVASVGSQSLKLNACESEENSVLPGQATVT